MLFAFDKLTVKTEFTTTGNVISKKFADLVLGVASEDQRPLFESIETALELFWADVDHLRVQPDDVFGLLLLELALTLSRYCHQIG